jgi:diguanylate cyclase (GGDEF)-like protein
MAGFISALGLFHILFARQIVPYSAVNLVFLSGAPLGYCYPGAAAYAMSASSWIILYPVFVFLYRIDPLNAAAPIAIFNGLLFAGVICRNIISDSERDWAARLSEGQSRRCRLKEDLERSAKTEASLKGKEAAIISLYEITKRMSAVLRFDDIFGILSSFLKDNFTFGRCGLLILKYEDDEMSAEREYTVWNARTSGDPGAGPADGDRPDYRKLIEMFSEGFSGIYMSRSENPLFFEDLGMKRKEIGTFAAIPLLSERKIVGVLTADNLPKEDLERMTILSMQFALEIKKMRLYEMVERMAITDSLTGLYVRRHFLERLGEEFKRSKRHQFKFAFLMLDIDDFKRCNDTYGHLVGDAVLKEIARIIKENVREIDITCRYGGEELALVLPETGRESGVLVAERLRRKIDENIFKAYDEKLKVTISAGMSVYPEDSAEVDQLMEEADMALYAAKKSGKNVVCTYKKEYNGHA